MKFSDMPYKRIDFDDVKKRIGELIDRFDEAKSGEEQFKIHEDAYKIFKEVNTQYTLASIRFTINTADEFYSAEQDYYDEKYPEYESLCVKYRMKLFNSKYRPFLEEKIGKVAFKNMELDSIANDEKLISLKQEENSITKKYDKLLASAKIEFDNKELNLSMLRPYLINPDRKIREAAWEKMTEFFMTNSKELDDLYDKLVSNRTKQGRVMGYENYAKLGYMRMRRNDYTMEQVRAFRDQIKKYYVPFAEKLHDERRKRLGLDKLSFIDESVFFKEGNPKPVLSPDEILKKGQQMYSELSKETKEFYDFMMECNLFDVLSRPNKKTGGYMTYLDDYKAPFIFANFNGTEGDADVITHECGHAFQGFISGKDPIMEHADIGMETAEIHSMSMEFFTGKWMTLFFGDGADNYRKMHLEDAIMFIPYGCMVDEFQEIVYLNPDMTPDERKQAWKKLEKEYKPHLDYGDNKYFGNGAFWQKQHHIYDLPFYYIDYCLAQVCALQYKVWMNEDYKGAWASYLKLCELSAGDFYTNMLKTVGLKSPFEDGCIQSLVEKLEKIVK